MQRVNNYQSNHSLLPRRPIALLVEASSCYEALEDYESAAEQRHLAAVAADAAGLQQRRNKEAAAWARLLRAADDDVETAPT